MTGHVCADVRDMCDFCQARAEDAHERVNDPGEPLGGEW